MFIPGGRKTLLQVIKEKVGDSCINLIIMIINRTESVGGIGVRSKAWGAQGGCEGL